MMGTRGRVEGDEYEAFYARRHLRWTRKAIRTLKRRFRRRVRRDDRREARMALADRTADSI